MEQPPPLSEKVSLGIRLLSMFIDHFIMSLLAIMLVIPTLLPELMAIQAASESPPEVEVTKVMVYLFALGYAFYFCKDMFGGRNLAKRMLNLQVVDTQTGETASPIKCVLRNLLLPIGFIEVAVVLFNPSRRLGDYLSGTEVVPFNREKEIAPMNFLQLFIALLLAIGFASMLLPSFQEVLDVTLNGAK